jgi:hypothetical protein
MVYAMLRHVTVSHINWILVNNKQFMHYPTNIQYPHCRRFDPGGSLDRRVIIVAACPSPDGLARDGTQGGKNAARVILRQRGCACSRGYKRSRGREREREREREPVLQPVLPRDHPSA